MATLKNDYFIKEVCRALDLLEQFSPDNEELDVSTVCENLKLRKEKALRLLYTLETHKFISKSARLGRYRLAPKVFFIGQKYIENSGLSREAGPVLEKLAGECGETVDLTVIKDSQVVCVYSVETSQAVRVVSRVGVQFPVHCTAPGKIHLAFMDENDFEQAVNKLELKAHTSNTITDKAMFRNHISKVSKNGFSVDWGEFENGICAVSAPVYDYTRKVIGAISISVPCIRISRQRINSELAPLVIKASNNLSIKLGYPEQAAVNHLMTHINTDFKIKINPDIDNVFPELVNSCTDSDSDGLKNVTHEQSMYLLAV